MGDGLTLKIVILKAEQCDVFCQLRLKLFEAVGEINQNTDVSELALATKKYYLSHIEKDLLCWGISLDDKIVSMASLCLFSRLPYLENLSGIEGYILNVYTLPSFREKGMAEILINTIIDYAKKNSVKRLWLNSSEQGKSIYKKCGFVEKNNEMELYWS